jgi:hypothetical protein
MTVEQLSVTQLTVIKLIVDYCEYGTRSVSQLSTKLADKWTKLF